VLETRHGTCIFANDEWVRLSGLTREQSLGHGWAKAIHRDDIDDVIRCARAGAEENAAWEKGFRLVRPDGTIAWVAGRAGPLADDNGK
jgi:PAS domain S-box-containing protein